MFLPMKARADYLRLNKSEGRFFRDAFVARFVPSPSRVGMVGITATKKLGNAVKRHRAKRRLREVLRLWSKESTVALRFDIVLIARKAIFDIKFADLRDEWSDTLAKLSATREIV